MMLRHDYELRDASVSGRTITLALVPFDTPTWIREDDRTYREVFRRGAFDHVMVDPRRTKLTWDHRLGDLDARYGSGVSMREDGGYLIGDFKVIGGARADHLLDLVEARELRGVSIGFVPGEDRAGEDADGPLLERVRVKQLPEASLVDQPAYPQAEVLALHRSAIVDQERERVRAWVRDMRRAIG